MNAHDIHNPVQSIVVAGGGAAGWLTAAVIAAEHNVKNNPSISVTLVESPDVKILGVGEGTWPTMRDTLRKIGIDESTLIAKCDASFKQGTRFVNWRHTPKTGSVDCYDHPFSLPAGFFEGDVGAWWLLHQSQPEKYSFSQAVSTQSALCDLSKAPKQPQTPAYAAVANYGYHLDANKFAELLKLHSIDVLGVRYVNDHIEGVQADSDNNISALRCRNGVITGDLFVDCTGFVATLIDGHYQSPFTSVSHGLKNDSAMAVQASYINDNVDIASATLSTAHDSGWIWDIGLPHRKGVGCVYSSEFCSDEKAADTLLAYVGSCTKTQCVSEDAVRKISFSPGYRATPWVHNCVAVGTSAGFVEPLEASALVMVELSAQFIAQNLPPHTGLLSAVSAQFNQHFSRRWQRIVDFLKLHYVLSGRTDSPYWRHMTDMTTASEQLTQWLEQWVYRPVSTSDFIYADELFPAASYMYVLYGMRPSEQFALNEMRYPDSVLRSTQQAVAHNEKKLHQQLAALPSNRELINIIRQRNSA